MSRDLEKLTPATREIVEKAFAKIDAITEMLDRIERENERLDNFGKPKAPGIDELNKLVAARAADKLH